MTDAELDEAAAKLKALQQHTKDGIHAFNNLVAIWQGEWELAMRGARKVVDGLQQALDEFYRKYPEFKEGL